jgi:hypothetical protein
MGPIGYPEKLVKKKDHPTLRKIPKEPTSNLDYYYQDLRSSGILRGVV